MMENKIKDGGSAFPTQHEETIHGKEYSSKHTVYNSGMSLRDWFAGMALQGIMAAPKRISVDCIDIAIDAYKLADAMIKEKEKTND